MGKDLLVPQSTYVHEVRAALPAEAFAPSPSRLLLVPIYYTVIAVAIWAIAFWVPWFVAPLLSLVIGSCFALLAFVGHEGVHGGIVRNRTGRQLLGFIAFMPFGLSPRLWAAWHDRVHHSSANVAGDPDMYPTLEEYKTDGFVRFFVDKFSPGGRKWRGLLSLALGFTIQSAQQLVFSKRRGFLKPGDWWLAIAETVVGFSVWVTLAALIGGVPFLFAYVIPLLIGNSIVMAFILTNHALSPRVEINDPLVNGLSVTSPRWIEWIHARFRLPRRAPRVPRDELPPRARRTRAADPALAGPIPVDAARESARPASPHRPRLQGCRDVDRSAHRRGISDVAAFVR